MRTPLNDATLILINLAILYGGITIPKQKTPIEQPISYVTYELSGGRFGDNLTAYIHAKWIAYKKNIPLLYKPFPYSDQLVMHDQAINFRFPPKNGTKTQRISKNNDLFKINPSSGALYVIPYFAEAEMTRATDKSPLIFDVDWHDQQFLQELRHEIAPRNKIALILPPQDCISVALHLRKGGGFDPNFLEGDPLFIGAQKKDYTDMGFPEKFASDEFYLGQLKQVLSLVGNRVPVYAYLFTDDKDPARLATRYSKILNNPPNLTFDYHGIGNSWTANVLEDFFSMMRFDCIIRPESNFSIIASRLGYQLATFVSTRLHWQGDKLIIDKVDSTISQHFFEKIKRLQVQFETK